MIMDMVCIKLLQVCRIFLPIRICILQILDKIMLVFYHRNMTTDITFMSEPEYGIPILLPTQQLVALPHPVRIWGTQSRQSEMLGTYAFYTWDYKFRALWKKPGQLIATGCRAAIEPNFSITPQMSRAEVLYRTYQKRWLSRYWQMRGVRVMVDMNVPPPFTARENLLGVPKGWSAYATRVHRMMYLSLEEVHAICADHAGTMPLFVVYGGGRKIAEQCAEQQWMWIPEKQRVGDRAL